VIDIEPLPTTECRRPLVSLLLPTRDRPSFLPLALECRLRQTYPNIELVVLDHGAQFPVDRDVVARAGGRVIRVDPDVTLGEAMNAGIAAATGEVCIKVDDDDWYAPAFVARWIDVVRDHWDRPISSFVLVPMRFLVFDVARWEIRTAPPGQFSGAALAFLRSDGLAQPFRPYERFEDANFYFDIMQTRGAIPLDLDCPEEFIAVRHGAAMLDRGHTWISTPQDRLVEDELRERPVYEKRPDELIAAWALPFYRSLHAAAVDRSAAT
jgi:glycosyltransferase involved in cell wall biosynthesis